MDKKSALLQSAKAMYEGYVRWRYLHFNVAGVRWEFLAEEYKIPWMSRALEEVNQDQYVLKGITDG